MNWEEIIASAISGAVLVGVVSLARLVFSRNDTAYNRVLSLVKSLNDEIKRQTEKNKEIELRLERTEESEKKCKKENNRLQEIVGELKEGIVTVNETLKNMQKKDNEGHSTK